VKFAPLGSPGLFDVLMSYSVGACCELRQDAALQSFMYHASCATRWSRHLSPCRMQAACDESGAAGLVPPWLVGGLSENVSTKTASALASAAVNIQGWIASAVSYAETHAL
jgi:hypothetical protein